ncbi:FRG domain-containing protein [Fundidesulfovibrio terrae]|uniref:FRG domain-containing protein n=1 Tax=Fundidesulfovibrio terrae TaxID=2922866 RepID=UPI001FAEE3AD|nr:FRG domain-containing protein [Fundidesulfovibrio terrae]
MIGDIIVDSWNDFEDELARLEEMRSSRRAGSNFIYRGQSDASYELETTLDRKQRKMMPIAEYHGIIEKIKPQIEVFSGGHWDTATFQKSFDAWLDDNDSYMPHSLLLKEFNGTLRYMFWLRHYGFPSPLLDWTGSPYIASYFAFNGARDGQGHVAVFVYLDSMSEFRTKSGWSGEPVILNIGPFGGALKRHYNQKSEYTLCVMRKNEHWIYAPYEGMFMPASDDSQKSRQDLLWKITIPWSKRNEFMSRLDKYYNINALSLFDSSEALMDTLAFRVFS